MNHNIEIIKHHAAFCVIGGGMAGICAAVAAAREGVPTILIHDRPVLGGNASSEIRMCIGGAARIGMRESGLIEEILLTNLAENPYKLFPMWDAILLDFVRREENLTLLLNCSCFAAETEGDRIVSVSGWQCTTYTRHTVYADLFADCSGDSITAYLTHAEYRTGRESSNEFGESLAPEKADNGLMGMSCLITACKTDEVIPFKAPSWAWKLKPEDLKHRRAVLESRGENFWFLELSGTVQETEKLRDDLLALAFGYWDYVKNSGEFDADCWQLSFVGALPGKRESFRMVGKYILNQRDVENGVIFDDTVAYGGWPLDDHDPAGFLGSGEPNRVIHLRSVYGIPYRCLYSVNIDNLFFAGRNISMTHAALSSSRVMATCSVIGQAVGSAAAVAHRYGETPDQVLCHHIRELQQMLLKNDCYLPGFRYEVSELTKLADLTVNKKENPDAERLRNGDSRGEPFLCPAGAVVRYTFPVPSSVSEIRLVFDSDLQRDTLPGEYDERDQHLIMNQYPGGAVMHLPTTLVRHWKVTVYNEDGRPIQIFEDYCNIRRLIRLQFDGKASAISLEAWGADDSVRIIAFDVS